MNMESTVVTFLVLIVANVYGATYCYVGKSYHGCSSSSLSGSVNSQRCSTSNSYCGYYQAESSSTPGCTVVAGFCSDYTTKSSCESDIGSRTTWKIEKKECCSNSYCNKDATKTPSSTIQPASASAGAVAGSLFGATIAITVIVWVVICVCFWGICAGIIAGIVCCVTKSMKARRQQAATTTVTHHVSQPAPAPIVSVVGQQKQPQQVAYPTPVYAQPVAVVAVAPVTGVAVAPVTAPAPSVAYATAPAPAAAVAYPTPAVAVAVAPVTTAYPKTSL